jgi:hypothetical protein
VKQLATALCPVRDLLGGPYGLSTLQDHDRGSDEGSGGVCAVGANMSATLAGQQPAMVGAGTDRVALSVCGVASIPEALGGHLVAEVDYPVFRLGRIAMRIIDLEQTLHE